MSKSSSKSSSTNLTTIDSTLLTVTLLDVILSEFKYFVDLSCAQKDANEKIFRFSKTKKHLLQKIDLTDALLLEGRQR